MAGKFGERGNLSLKGGFNLADAFFSVFTDEDQRRVGMFHGVTCEHILTPNQAATLVCLLTNAIADCLPEEKSRRRRKSRKQEAS